MENLLFNQIKLDKPERCSPLALAFVGDAVYSLLVRTRLLQQANRPVDKLHKGAAEQVRAGAQAEAYCKIAPLLTEQEAELYRRGRNAHTGSLPKNASAAEYHSATGLEALFGWLYLAGETERIYELFDIICENGENE